MSRTPKEGAPEGHGAAAAEAHDAEAVGIDVRQRAGEIGGRPTVRHVNRNRRHPEHRGVEVVEVAPVAAAGVGAVLGFGALMTLALADPVDGEGDEAGVRHLSAVIVVRLPDGVAQRLRGVVAHDGVFAEVGVAVPAEDRRALLVALEVGGVVDEEDG